MFVQLLIFAFQVVVQAAQVALAAQAVRAHRPVVLHHPVAAVHLRVQQQRQQPLQQPLLLLQPLPHVMDATVHKR